MSWDVSFFSSRMPPPSVSELPKDWYGDSLGGFEDVRRKISSLLPEVDWSDPTWGRYNAEGFSLEFNMGNSDPSNGFVVHVRGGGNAVGSIEKIAQIPDWYAFDTSQGEWLHHCSNSGEGWAAFQDYRDRVIGDTQDVNPEIEILDKIRRWFRLSSGKQQQLSTSFERSYENFGTTYF
ncbi:MAG: hypothetical protein ACR2QW_05985 [bacterium]